MDWGLLRCVNIEVDFKGRFKDVYLRKIFKHENLEHASLNLTSIVSFFVISVVVLFLWTTNNKISIIAFVAAVAAATSAKDNKK